MLVRSFPMKSRKRLVCEVFVTFDTKQETPIAWWLLGRVVNSLDFCPVSLKSLSLLLLPVHTFFTKEGGDSESVNFTLPTLKTFLEVCSQKVSGHKPVACAIGFPKMHFFHEIVIFRSAKKRHKDIFSILHPLSLVIFATATVLAFVLLCNSRFNFHCYTQREAMPTHKYLGVINVRFLEVFLDQCILNKLTNTAISSSVISISLLYVLKPCGNQN